MTRGAVASEEIVNKMTARTCIVALACVLSLSADVGGQQEQGDNVILVTLDGARTQEMFGGLDATSCASTLKADQPVEATPTFSASGRDREERRQKLMPFLWQLMSNGRIDRRRPAVGSSVQLRNRLWFSYPGYAEILLGEAARRRDQEQRSDPQSLHHRARADPRAR